MSELFKQLSEIQTSSQVSKPEIVAEIKKYIEGNEYTIVELNDQKPWGAYFRFDSEQADAFVKEFFPGLSPVEARLGIPNAELSPKILLVSPGQRLSWQYHNRRAERWAFLTDGAYNKSDDDDQGAPNIAKAGDIVQFATAERHRLIGGTDKYSLVAEIWQHTDPSNTSDEDDIIRLQDDYNRG